MIRNRLSTNIFCLIILLIATSVNCEIQKQLTVSQMIRGNVHLIPGSYDASIVPRGESGDPVKVDADVAVLNIRSIKEAELMYTLDVFFTIQWNDDRIKGPWTKDAEDGLVLDGSKWKSKLWIPDINFKNSVSNRVVSALSPLEYLTIYNTTRVRLSSRMSLDLLCEMNFSNYPHDTQTCFFDIISLSHNNKSVILNWRSLYISTKLYMTRFQVFGKETSTCDRTYKGIGTMSCIRGSMKLKRFVGHFVIQKYVPSTIIVMMCFIGFWIPANAYPARTALSITALLALITQQMSVSSLNVSYVMALNVWMLICITFVFLSLIELAFSVIWEQQSLKRKQFKNANGLPPSGGTRTSFGSLPGESPQRFRSGTLATATAAAVSMVSSGDCVAVPVINSSKSEMNLNGNTFNGNGNRPSKGCNGRRKSIVAALGTRVAHNVLMESPNPVDTYSRILFPFFYILCTAIYFSYVYGI